MKPKNTFKMVLAVLLLLGGILIGKLLFGTSQTLAGAPVAQEVHSVYTCSMHPHIRQPEPGDCPICGMDLIPLEESPDNDFDQNSIKLSDKAMALANVQTIVVGAKSSQNASLKFFGKVQPNENLNFIQTTHFPGRIEAMYVTFEGQSITKGQKLASVYSPELVNAQEELLLAAKNRARFPQLYEAARQKLSLWKLSDTQIDRILTRGKPETNFIIYAERSGYVKKLNVAVGNHIAQGQALFELIDLSQLWVEFEVYESDMAQLNIGDSIRFSLSGYPNLVFSKPIRFIEPTLDSEDRVVIARVEIDNTSMQFKPEMFATGTFRSSEQQQAMSIFVPKSAVLWTGETSLVYVKNIDSGINLFTHTVVKTGRTSGDSVEVLSGLSPGAEIVVKGAFAIDAAAQIEGKISMMNPDGQKAAPKLHDHSNHSPQSQTMKTLESNEVKNLPALIDVYLRIKDFLVADDLLEAQASMRKISQDFPEAKELVKLSTSFMTKNTLDEARVVFHDFSELLIERLKRQEQSLDLFVQHCPMTHANGGSTWISREQKILNPYHGAAMLNCGETKYKL
ncbi:MAG: efflux RND transporter periplasmic adaptor subunit [Flavobacteriaceae bacterium]|nr:efflux RND transporter periplasmic adaptor subunit [Flavobacteriaceae bacterium]